MALTEFFESFHKRFKMFKNVKNEHDCNVSLFEIFKLGRKRLKFFQKKSQPLKRTSNEDGRLTSIHAFTARTISFFPGGPGNVSTTKFKSFKSRFSWPLAQ
jgi:hypothetical protein